MAVVVDDAEGSRSKESELNAGTSQNKSGEDDGADSTDESENFETLDP